MLLSTWGHRSGISPCCPSKIHKNCRGVDSYKERWDWLYTHHLMWAFRQNIRFPKCVLKNILDETMKFWFKKNLIDVERERETLICATHLWIHWLILVYAWPGWSSQPWWIRCHFIFNTVKKTMGNHYMTVVLNQGQFCTPDSQEFGDIWRYF